MKPITLTRADWTKLNDRLKVDYKPSVTLSRSKMKEVLGFTPREHQDYMREMDYLDYTKRRCIHLDFFDDAKRTMFVLKYSEYFTRDNETENW